jgi:hypothetical protein
MKRFQDAAKAKVKKFQGKHFCAYLTPAEGIYLISIGCKLSKSNSYKKEMFSKMVAIGQSGGSWVYF